VKSRKIPIQSNGPSSPQPDSDSFEQSGDFRVVDRRHFTQENDETTPAGVVEEKPRFPTYVEELMARVAETERRFSEKVKQLDQETARTRARLESEYERRLARDRQELLLPFLDVLDNLERAIRAAEAGGQKHSLMEGLKMTADLFRSGLRAHAVEPIEVENQPFDPNLCQAVGVVAVPEQERDGIVVEELVRGYRMGNSLLRPAQVRVARFVQESATGA